ncbi:MAG: DUF808 domain-containing protein [Burkholderiaceae bacterium]|jgi:predicted DNA repair protein MutK|nr:DUF808 domain-containing protein [Burkholderiaceae bacterium]
MASSLLALLDDIATLLDDVAVMSKISVKKAAAMTDDVAALTKLSARKTAGVLGDDLALNAQQVAGVSANRELPVVWAVAKGSLLNKAILVPAALFISALAPALVTPLLMAGGAFLCFEGAEKLAHKLLHPAAGEAARNQALAEALAEANVDALALEKQKVKGAVRTDFVLSAEIITLSLGTVTGQPFWMQSAVLAAIALIMTAGVYGLVAAIVKLDDLGLWLSQRGGALTARAGRGILVAAPWFMKFLSVAGTAAMFLVGGGILVHGLPGLHHLLAAWTQGMAAGGLAQSMASMVFNGATGTLAGAALVAGWALARRLRGGKAAAGH